MSVHPAVDERDPYGTDDEAAPYRSSGPSTAAKVGGAGAVVAAIVAVACVYEIAAEAVNRELDMDALPSVCPPITGFSTWKLAKLTPSWARSGSALSAGFSAYLAGAAVASRRRRR